MTNQIIFVLFNLSVAIFLYISMARGLRDKQLKITLVSPPTTKVEKIVLTGRGLTVAIIGWGISAILLTYIGLNALFQYAYLGTNLFLTLISISLAVFTMVIASYVTPHPKE
jgi:hypothetical protein